MPVYQYLDLSTAHLTDEDRHELAHGLCPLRVIEHDYGWWVHVPGDDDITDRLAAVSETMSEAFVGVLKHANKHGCNWINFDADADEEPELPSFGE